MLYLLLKVSCEEAGSHRTLTCSTSRTSPRFHAGVCLAPPPPPPSLRKLIWPWPALGRAAPPNEGLEHLLTQHVIPFMPLPALQPRSTLPSSVPLFYCLSRYIWSSGQCYLLQGYRCLPSCSTSSSQMSLCSGRRIVSNGASSAAWRYP